MKPFRLDRPATIPAALRILATDRQAKVLAGGTDLMTLMRDGVSAPTRLVDVRRLELDQLRWRRDGTVHIGATYSNQLGDARLAAEFPVLAEAVASGASQQIRNMATTGGNLLQRTRCTYFRLPEFACNRRSPGSGCAAIAGDSAGQAILGASASCNAVHPSDLAVALQALDAVVQVRSARGSRDIPIDDFHRIPGGTPQLENTLAPDELIIGVELLTGARSRHSHYVKFRERTSYAFALASAAVAVELRGDTVVSARVALGGVAVKPWRARAAEAALVGHRFDDATIGAAAAAATQGAQPRTDNRYKVELAREVVRRALTELGARR